MILLDAEIWRIDWVYLADDGDIKVQRPKHLAMPFTTQTKVSDVAQLAEEWIQKNPGAIVVGVVDVGFGIIAIDEGDSIFNARDRDRQEQPNKL